MPCSLRLCVLGPLHHDLRSTQRLNRHRCYQVRLIAEEERMTTELWRSWSIGGIAEFACALELLLGVITAVIAGIGVLLCLMGADRTLATGFAERECCATDEDRLLSATSPAGESGQMAIRLEPRWSRLFRRHGFVVTIR